MLIVTNLKYSYTNTEQNFISYPNWEIERGNHGIILGNSGCGKTTLLHLIGGLMIPKGGKIEVAGHNLSEKSNAKLTQFRGENIGIIFQKPHLVYSLSVQENLVLAQYLARKKQDHKRVIDVLESLGIKSLAKRKINQISQGQAQRVAIARAVINFPKLLLADEPTANLDDENCQKAIEVLKLQAKKTGATLIVATHDYRVKNQFKNKLSL